METTASSIVYQSIQTAADCGWIPLGHAELQELAASRSQFYQQANENGMVKQVLVETRLQTLEARFVV